MSYILTSFIINKRSWKTTTHKITYCDHTCSAYLIKSLVICQGKFSLSIEWLLKRLQFCRVNISLQVDTEQLLFYLFLSYYSSFTKNLHDKYVGIRNLVSLHSYSSSSFHFNLRTGKIKALQCQFVEKSLLYKTETF